MYLVKADVNMQESQENIVRLEDDSLDIVSCLVEYLYRSEYPEVNFEKHSNSWKGMSGEERFAAEAGFHELCLHRHIDVFVLADRYDVSGLGKLATKKFKKILDDIWLGMLFLETIPTIYEVTMDQNCGLRNAVAEHARARWYMIKSVAEEEVKARFEELIATSPDFAVDFVRCWLEVGYNDLCSECGNVLDAASTTCIDCLDERYRHC